MECISNLAVIIDPTAEQQPCVDKAAVLAQACRAAIDLVACETTYSREARIARAAAGREAAPESLSQLLERLAGRLRSRGIDTTIHALQGEPLHESLLTWLRGSVATFVVKDTHHHSLARRTFLTNTDWHLIRGCSQPLLLVKPAPWHRPPVLIAAVDPTHPRDQAGYLDRCILDHALSIGKALQAEVHAAHSFVPMMLASSTIDGLPVMMDVTGELLRAQTAARRTRIKAVTDPCGLADDRVHVEMGIPSEFLPRLAAEVGADVVVMGATARSGLRGAFVGSTAERLLEGLPCDLLVVKTPDFGALLPF